MSKKQKNRSSEKSESDELLILKKINRQLEVLVGLHVVALKNGRTQSDVITALASVGCQQGEIAKLLGTTSNTVNVALHRAKQSKPKK